MDQDYLTLHGGEQKERVIALPVIHYFLLIEPVVHINVPFGFPVCKLGGQYLHKYGRMSNVAE